MPEDLIRIGQITSAHGVHGHVKVYPLTEFPERYETLRQVLLGPEARPVAVKLLGTLKNLLILSIEGVQSAEAAERLKLQYLQVPKSEVHPLPEGHYYLFDLVGLAVVDPEGNALGRLVEVNQSSPVHDLYVVETSPGKRFMVPAVREFVKAIDLPAGQVVIKPIPGLLED